MEREFAFYEKAIDSQNYRELFLRILCILTAIVLLARDIFGFDIPKFIFIGLALILALISNIDHMFMYTSFIIPIATGLPYSYIFMVFLIVLVIKKPEWIFNIKMMPLLLIIFVIEPLSIFYGVFAITEYIGMLSVLIVIFSFIYNYSDESGFTRSCQLYLAGFILASVVVVFKTISSASVSNLLAYGIRLGDVKNIASVEGIAVNFDPNTLAVFSAIALAVSIILLKNSLSHRWSYLFVMIFSVIIGIATMSRTFILLGAIILIYIIITTYKSIKGFIYILAILCVLLFLFFMLNKLYPSIISNMAQRFTSSDISNGRIQIFMSYAKAIINDPAKYILGLGIQKYQIKSGLYVSCHNGIQEIFVIWGLIGSILVAIMFTNVFRRIKRVSSGNSNKVKYLPIIILITGVQLIQFFSQYILIMVLLVTFSAAMIYKQHGDQS